LPGISADPGVVSKTGFGGKGQKTGKSVWHSGYKTRTKQRAEGVHLIMLLPGPIGSTYLLRWCE
jgi:hypothetical protein